MARKSCARTDFQCSGCQKYLLTEGGLCRHQDKCKKYARYFERLIRARRKRVSALSQAAAVVQLGQVHIEATAEMGPVGPAPEAQSHRQDGGLDGEPDLTQDQAVMESETIVGDLVPVSLEFAYFIPSQLPISQRDRVSVVTLTRTCGVRHGAKGSPRRLLTFTTTSFHKMRILLAFIGRKWGPI